MMANSAPLIDALASYRTTIENLIQAQIQKIGSKSTLRDACEYALMNGGKRFRPVLVLMMAKALGNKADVSLAALAVEFFHTASLIADDLPCMDDDDIRRNKPSLHKVYGEPVSLLCTYALISAGYDYLAQNAKAIGSSSVPFAKQADRLGLLAIENVSFNTGVEGAAGGQFLDISPPNITLDVLREIIHKKTVTLFEMSFVLGWLFGGGEISKLPQVKQCASHFGMAFQIADDIGDMQQDIINERVINLANVCGKDLAINMFHEELRRFKEAMSQLGLRCDEFFALAEMLSSQVKN